MVYGIIFRENYVNYDEFNNVSLTDINNILVKNNIFLELGDEFSNDWGGFSYYYCKKMGDFDDKTISSFTYIITWFMTGNPIEINPNFDSGKYFKNDLIIKECLKLYNNFIEDYNSPVGLCEKLFIEIYNFYVTNSEKYIKKTERLNFVLTYKELELFNKIDSNNKNYTEKLRYLLNQYK